MTPRSFWQGLFLPLALLASSWASAGSSICVRAISTSSNPQEADARFSEDQYLTVNGSGITLRRTADCTENRCVGLSCFDSGVLQHDTANQFVIGETWVGTRAAATTIRWDLIKSDGTLHHLCSMRHSGYESTERGCEKSISIGIHEIMPEIGAEFAAIKDEIIRLQRELAAFEQDRDSIESLIDFINQRITQLESLDLTSLPPGFLDQYSQELSAARLALRNAQTALAEGNHAVAQNLESSGTLINEVSSSLDELTTLFNEDDFSVGLIDIIEIPPLEPDPEEPFDLEENPYKDLANKTVERLQTYWEANARSEFLEHLTNWNATVEHMKGVLASRSEVSSMETEAFAQSISVVHNFLYKTGCDGQGCLDSGQIWFLDSGVTREYWEGLAGAATAFAELFKALGEAADQSAHEAAMREFASWKSPLTPVQLQAVRAYGELSKSAGEFLAYRRMRTDLDNAQFREGLMILREMQISIAEGASFAGRVVVSLAPGLNDAVDWCELRTGFEMCDPGGGQKLGNLERAVTSLGLIWGSGKAYRMLLDAAGEASGAVRSALSLAKKVEDSAGKALANGDNTVAFAKGTGMFPFMDKSRAQHAAQHLVDGGLIPNWSNKTYDMYKEIGQNLMENPIKTFDHVLRGNSPVKSFYGKFNGTDVVFHVYKSGPNQGKIATSIIPSAEQMANWGLLK